jgi:hypothetical protein
MISLQLAKILEVNIHHKQWVDVEEALFADE